jgi:hypothetical protein
MGHCVCGEWGTDVRMAGGYNACLCNDCRNLWHKHCEQKFNELGRAQICVTVAVEKQSEDSALKAYAKYRLVEEELFDMAEAWLAEQKKEED